jgi:polysaccharide export outer membrane protein
MNDKVLKWIILLPGFFIFSCSVSKIKYFKDLPAETAAEINTAKFPDPVIQSDDILSITVNTVDPAASEVINNGNTPKPTGGVNIANNIGQQLISGYYVDRDGNVEMPILGKLKLAGLTTLQAREVVRKQAERFFKEPAVNIRYANYKVTILGEVTRPGTYVVPNEKVSLLDALGYAGDLTIYGKRSNVLLIRKQGDGKSKAIKFDLTKKEILNSEYFYLSQNDVLYVEPAKAKYINSDTSVIRYLSLAASLVSVWVLLVTQTSLGD